MRPVADKGQTEGQTDRQTDMTKLTVAFSNFANAPKTMNGSEVDNSVPS